MQDQELVFQKSTYSANGQDCVEVAQNVVGLAAVRDTQNRQAGHLAFNPAEFRAFVDAVVAGEL